MVGEKVSLSSYFINLLFFLYFAILFTERLQSVVRSIADPAVHPMGSGFHRYVYVMTFCSLAVGVIFLIVTNYALFPALFTRSAKVYAKVNLGTLSIAAGILLLSGMVHTEYTITPLQFVAYGALIIAMFIRTATVTPSSGNPALLWLSLIYLTAFSMAIPVMYETQGGLSTLVHVIEAVTAILLVFVFTYFMRIVFVGDATNLFFWLPILVTAVLDGVLIALRWKGTGVTFVLIFLIVACVLFCVGKTLSLVKK
ncbi:MAG: hypothetical protein ACI3XE_03565 [Eubacteriales bacterium]